MTITHRQFLYFAKFLPNKSKENKPLSFFKRKVDKLMRGKNVEFKGFKNLADLSSSKLGRYIQKHIADQWGINTSKYSMYKNAYYKKAKNLNESDIEELKDRIEYYLLKGFYPRIVESRGGVNKNAHVVFVTKLFESTNSKCLIVEIFNTGTRKGGSLETETFCKGSFVYMPEDEKYYFYDFYLNSKAR